MPARGKLLLPSLVPFSPPNVRARKRGTNMVERWELCPQCVDNPLHTNGYGCSHLTCLGWEQGGHSGNKQAIYLS